MPKLGRVSGEIQAGINRGYLGAIKDDPDVQELLKEDSERKMVITVRDTINTRAS